MKFSKRTRKIGITFSIFMIYLIFAGLKYHSSPETTFSWICGSLIGLTFGYFWIKIIYEIDKEKENDN